VEAKGFIGGQLGFGARRVALQGTDIEDCRWWLGGAHRGTWRASQGCMVRSARVPFTRKGGQERWPTAGGARQAVTRAGSAGVRGSEGRGRSKAKSRAERVVFTREIGEKGDARGGQAASARYRGAGSAARAAKGRVEHCGRAEESALPIWGRKGSSSPGRRARDGSGSRRGGRAVGVLRVRAMRHARSRAGVVASGPGRKEKKARRAGLVRAGVGGRAGRVSRPRWPAGSSWALGGFWVGLRIGSGRAGLG